MGSNQATAAEKTPKRELTRQRVIRAAIDCIYEEGFHAANTNRIAERAEVSWGVLQYHFGDKDGLLQAVSDTIFEDFTQTISEAHIDEADLRRRVRHLVDVVWSLVNCKEYRVSIAILRNAGKDPKSNVDPQQQLASWSRKVDRLWSQLFEPENFSASTSETAKRLLFASLRGMADDINPRRRASTRAQADLLEALTDSTVFILEKRG